MTMAVRKRNPCMHAGRITGVGRSETCPSAEWRRDTTGSAVGAAADCCNTSVCGKSSAETVPYRIDLLMESRVSVI